MEQQDNSLVETLFNENPRFRKLYEQHQILEKELVQLDERPHLSPEEEFERKKIQKLKLAGKDEMERILSEQRQQ